MLDGPFASRWLNLAILSRPIGPLRWLNLAILWELLLVILVVNVPLLQDAFGTRGLSPETWLIVAGSAFTIVPVLEVAKRMLRRRNTENEAAGDAERSA